MNCRLLQVSKDHNLKARMLTAPSSGAATSVDNLLTTGAGTLEVARIAGVRFGLATAETIERTAGAVIKEHSLFSKNLPKLHSPNDPGMGPCDRRVVCSTCHNGWFTCPQHMGVIRLPIPVFNPVHFDTVLLVLQSVCFSCSAVLVAGGGSTAGAAAAPKGRTWCGVCGLPQPKYKRGGHLVIRREWVPTKLAELAKQSPGTAAAVAAGRPFTAADALEVFKAMGPADIRGVGMDPDLSPPAALVMQNVCVLPPAARPTVMAAEGSKRRGPDNNTTQLQNLTKAIRALTRAMNGGSGPTGKGSLVNPPTGPDACSEFKFAPAGARDGAEGYVPWTPHDVSALRDVLDDAVAGVTPAVCAAVWTQFPHLAERVQNEVAAMIHNSGRYAPLVKQRTGVPQRSLHNRLVGKGGRMRCNIFAKRADQTARGVIRPDKWLDVDQVGLPWAFMNTLTRPEEVHAGNLQRLTAAVAIGPNKRGGAARVLRANGTLVQLHLWNGPPLQLQPGDLVERHLVNGDVVLLNRQPTLHRLSKMAHRVVGVPGNAIVFPLGVMGPYNADCDGDEVNVHVVQSLDAEAEARMLIAVGANIMNPQTNAPCITLVQDARVGAMMLTRSTTRLTKGVMATCMAAIHYKLRGKEYLPEPAGGRHPATGEPLWTGRQLVTAMLPPGVFLERRVRGAGPEVTRHNDPEDRYVLIENGVHVSGALCKATLGAVAGGLVHRIFTTAGPRATLRFLSDFQRVVYTWLPTAGLTVGLTDCVPPISTTLAIKSASAATDAAVAELQRRAVTLGGAGALGPVEAATVEAYILTMVSATLDYTSRCVLQAQTKMPNSGLATMVTAGSKGSASNPAQVMGNLGQQVVDSERPPPDGVSLRTLPSFPAGALSGAARGFVTSSFLDGTSPTEYFQHMQAGREGLVATAVKTAITGYMFRTMAKAMETNTIQWDGSCRNAQGWILEYVAGGDALNPCAVCQVNMRPALMAGRAEVATRFAASSTAAFTAVQARLRRWFLTALYPTGAAATRTLLPINLRDELVVLGHDVGTGRVQRKGLAAVAEGAEVARLSCAAAVQAMVATVTELLPVAPTADALVAHVYWELTPAALQAAGLCLDTDGPLLTATVGATLRARLRNALAHPGECVGLVAAQSVGEPSTQFTLNAFHQAGMLQRRMTVGVPRLQELITATPRIKTPTTTAALRRDVPPPDGAAAAAQSLQFLCLANAVRNSYVVLDPVGGPAPGRPSVLVKDTVLLQHVTAVFGPEPAGASPWVVRMVLQRGVLEQHRYTPEGVARALGRQLPPDASVVVTYSEPSMKQWVVRVRLLADCSERAARVLHGYMLDSVLLGGIEHVRAVRLVDLPCMVEEAGGETAGGETAGGETAGGETAGGAALVQGTRQGVDMEGVALRALATRDWIDWTTVVTNDVVATAEVLGMVAARAVLFAELDKVVSAEGGYVDARHIAQLVATMTHRGFVMALSRHGINRTDYSVLQRASFEEPVDNLQAAAAAGTVDPLRGLSESIYVGAKAPLGTGTVAVQEDVDADIKRRRHGNEGAPLPQRVTVSSREQRGLPGAAKHFRENTTGTGTTTTLAATRLQEARAKLKNTAAPDFVIVTTGLNGATVSTAAGRIVPPPLPPLPPLPPGPPGPPGHLPTSAPAPVPTPPALAPVDLLATMEATSRPKCVTPVRMPSP
jgi:DNA-directed RNA polymerase II subunit RPB1